MRAFKTFLARHRTGSLLAAYLIVSITLLTVTSSSARIDLKRTGTTVVSVFQRGGAEIAGFFRRTINSFGELSRLRKDYEAIQEKLQEYRIHEREIAELRRENERLRKQRDYSKTMTVTYFAAEIIFS
jgi:cell shape-determining protein MreC